MRKLLQIILKFLKRKKLIRFITSALSIETCICAKFGRYEHEDKEMINMFAKQYFKVDLYIDKASVTQLYDWLCDFQNTSVVPAVAIQCVHTEKKVPCITVQVRGYDYVKDVIQELLSYSDNFGYIVWLSNEDDFVAVSQCMLSILTIDNMNVEIRVDKKDKQNEGDTTDEQTDFEEVETNDNESD